MRYDDFRGCSFLQISSKLDAIAFNAGTVLSKILDTSS